MTPALAAARAEFAALVDGLRPELHRYCARLAGSVIDGEDIVQDTLAKAFYALSLASETPNLRPWLFRIAHNTALDHLKRHDVKYTAPLADLEEVAGFEDHADPALVRLALVRFLVLPPAQRSAVVLKDVLGHSLEEIADTMEISVMAVKALLVRGRRALTLVDRDAVPVDPVQRELLGRYAAMFNARDWDGLRGLLREDCELDLVSKSRRKGKEVGMYFGQYAKLEVSVRVGTLDGRAVLAAFLGGADQPAYFILLEFEDGRVRDIRDFRYVPYIATDAVFQEV